MKLKIGDKVKVLSGKYRGQEGAVVQAFPKDGKVVVEGVNIVKTHQKPSELNPNGGVQEKTMPIAVSKVAYLTKSGKTTRIGYKIKADGTKVRVAIQDGGKEI